MAPPKKIKALRVTATAPRFRRAGLEFGRQARTLTLGMLTAEQQKALRDESGKGLVVVEVEIDAPETAAQDPAEVDGSSGAKPKA